MPATRFICPSGHEVNINQCLKKCIYTQRCMFLPTLRAVANSLNRKLQNATVTELLAGTMETFLKKTTDYAVTVAFRSVGKVECFPVYFFFCTNDLDIRTP